MDLKLCHLSTIARATHIPAEELEQNSLLLWAAYRDCGERVCIDVDVSKVAVEYYKSHYEFLKNSLVRQQPAQGRKYELLCNSEVYRGDNMTSFGNIIRAYFIWRDGLNNISVQRAAQNLIQEIYVEKGEEDERLMRLAGLTHSVGNLTPVPSRFNMERSGTFADMDYWDTTLHHIYHYLTEKDESWLEKLLDSRAEENDHLEESVQNTKHWLEYFDNDWEKFVTENGFLGYVDEQGRPKELWEGHLSKNRGIRELSPEEFWKMVENLCEITAERVDILGDLC